MATPAIRVDGLGKRYRIVHGQQRAKYATLRESLTDLAKAPFRKRSTVEQFWALNDVSFEVQPGEVVGIIGRNGAGKSTLLKVLSRITKPTTGRVEINGRVGSLLEVGTGFHPELTGRENIYLNGSILGMSHKEIAKQFDEIVAFAEVEKFLDTPVKRYSSGMYVRLAFAVAAHLEPEILIVDEVLAVGDGEFQKKCLGKMHDVSRAGRTVLFVSHNMGVVESLCQNALLLSAGGIIASGTASEVIQHYLRSKSGRGAVIDLTSKSNYFRAMRLLDETGTPTSTVSSGQPLTIDLDVQVPAGTRNPVFGVNIVSGMGTRVCTAATSFTEESFPVAAGFSTIRCVIRDLNLVAGVYSIRLGFDAAGVSERCDDAFQFEVVGRSLGGTMVPSSVHGVVAPPSKWIVHSGAGESAKIAT